MAHTITPAQHAAAVSRQHLQAPRGAHFCKVGEDQAAAIKRLRAATARAWKRPDARAFPTYKPGMSTAEYVAAYEGGNHLRHAGGATFWQPLNTAPAGLYDGGALDWAADPEFLADAPLASAELAPPDSAPAEPVQPLDTAPPAISPQPAYPSAAHVQPRRMAEALAILPTAVPAPTAPAVPSAQPPLAPECRRPVAPHRRMAEALAILASAVAPGATQQAPAAPASTEAPARPLEAPQAPAQPLPPTSTRRRLPMLGALAICRPQTACRRPPGPARPCRLAAGARPDQRHPGWPGRHHYPPPPVAASTLAPPLPIAASARQQGPP